MTACIIMHNMIIEDEQDASQVDFTYDAIDESSNISISHEHTPELVQFMQTHYDIRIQLDLMEHLWQLHGGQ